MFTRTVTFTEAREIEAGVGFVREHAFPVLMQQQGFGGLTVSVSKRDGVLGVLSMWETAEARDASDSALGKVREDGLDVIGGQLTVEAWEELHVEMVSPPRVGMPLLLRRVSMDPSLIEQNHEFFRTWVVPEMKASPGFCGVRNMMNRQTGQGLVGSVWTDQAAIEEAARTAEERRERAASRGITFGEQTRREIALIEFP